MLKYKLNIYFLKRVPVQVAVPESTCFPWDSPRVMSPSCLSWMRWHSRNDRQVWSLLCSWPPQPLPGGPHTGSYPPVFGVRCWRGVQCSDLDHCKVLLFFPLLQIQLLPKVDKWKNILNQNDSLQSYLIFERKKKITRSLFEKY